MDGAKQKAEEVFEAALELADAAGRKAFLDRACEGAPELRARLEKLLAVHERAEKFFDHCRPALAASAGEFPFSEEMPAVTSPAQSVEEPLGARIGPHKLLQKIGEGGCGVVYLAEQQTPVRRRVALKIIKLGMDTKSVIARFEAERQALAMMDHPNIARVLDAGATGTGRPYFVMELVNGIKITNYCDEHQLDTRQRLDLFIQVCHAIQHAHQKGIIHRDIKPSNILVTHHDGVPVPKVIDFGIAKATQEPLTEKTIFTVYGHFIGTPAYMSPEQAEMSGLDMDTRSDIYSLGVLLYELLTGKTPFDQKELLASGLDEMRRTLRQREPHRPSTRLNTLPREDLTATALHRHAEPLKLQSQLSGDLDWIVMKALEKDRTHRYETANALAMDIQRHLNNEPVLARPPSRFYRFQKLVRRNQAVFATVGAVAVALIIGLGAFMWLFVKERHARQRAVAAEQQQARMREEAETREKITQAALLVSQNQFQEADLLVRQISFTQPTLEGAAVYRSVGEWYACQNRWPEASDRFGTLLQINQLDGWNIATLDVLGCGAALAESGNTNGYERFRQVALARFADTANFTIAERMVKINLLLPANAKVFARLERLAEVALPKLPVSLNASSSASVAWRLNPSGSISAAALDPQATNTAALSPPALIGAYSYDGMTVGVEFSEPVDAASATRVANYSVSGVAVTNVTLGADGKSAVLWLAARLTGDFAVTVSDVADLAQNPIAAGSTVGNTVLKLSLQDFNTGQPFAISYAGHEATIVAGGADIWENADQFGYGHITVRGDFDYRLRINSLEPALHNFTRTGLMARDSLSDAGCREVMVGVNAENSFQVLVRTVASRGTASLPADPLPTAFGSNSWVRLQRVGTVFHAFSSSDGMDWVQLYQFDSATGAEGPFADPIHLGIATCAHSGNAAVTAVVSDLGVTPTVPVNTTLAFALLEYRRRDDAKAVEWCRRCLAHPEYNAARVATARTILAMCFHHLHDGNAARSQLAQSRELIGRKFESGLDLGGSAQGFWFDWVFARILSREATALIEDTASLPADHL